MNDVAFPVFVLCKDSGEICAFLSYQQIRGQLEAIDVENEEYGAYDANGFRLVLRAGTPKSEWLKIDRTSTQLPAGESGAVKAKAVTYKEREPLLRTLLRKVGLTKG